VVAAGQDSRGQDADLDDPAAGPACGVSREGRRPRLPERTRAHAVSSKLTALSGAAGREMCSVREAHGVLNASFQGCAPVGVLERLGRDAHNHAALLSVGASHLDHWKASRARRSFSKEFLLIGPRGGGDRAASPRARAGLFSRIRPRRLHTHALPADHRVRIAMKRMIG